ncbi:DUF4861 family protein [Flavobacterium silvaticum]|uniref:DUF4861 domain-containing protein n=1 Tax=Flavobacterium silvaticum TaxID=1852020 RepID=A0A972FV67_9FLAO|nr:DUF4861 family protein [Flavobacterium silvaticum]NMH28657.1 DUF4861 domain-containing protein [Flavobacterium silvaticum]
MNCIGQNQQKSIVLRVENALDFSRKEIVEIPKSKLLSLPKNYIEKEVRVCKSGTSDCLVLQWVDTDSDGKNDALLFVAEVAAKSMAKFEISVNPDIKIPEPEAITFSRFVPERTDDYAWENDKVAFRVYGPDAQQRFEQKRENGTLSSGIDLWFKRTEKAVINKWYNGYTSDPMFYHKDHGEGYDPYHVGASRGTGGTGIWYQDSLYVSKNFVSYKTIAVGPLRTIFEVTYAPFSPFHVSETKRISLDLGSNFSRIEVTYKNDTKLPDYAVGITLHDKMGKTNIDLADGIFQHTESIDGNWVSEAIIMNPDAIETAFAHVSKTPDQSHLLIIAKPTGKLVYFAGFAWEKKRDFQSVSDWEKALKKQAQIQSDPLQLFFE